MNKRHPELPVAAENGAHWEQFFLPFYLAPLIVTHFPAPALLLMWLFYVENRIICSIIMIVLFELILPFEEH